MEDELMTEEECDMISKHSSRKRQAAEDAFRAQEEAKRHAEAVMRREKARRVRTWRMATMIASAAVAIAALVGMAFTGAIAGWVMQISSVAISAGAGYQVGKM